MSNPVMGDKTPRTKKAMEEAGRLPTGDHSYGYMIAFAQSLELELAALRPEGRTMEMPTASEIRLACGELTAGEMRTIKAALGWFIQRHRPQDDIRSEK